MPLSWSPRTASHTCPRICERSARVGEVRHGRAGVAQDDEGVVAGAATGLHHVIDRHALAGREQGDERLVLGLLQPRQRERIGVAVPERPPALGEQLGVPGVAAVHLHEQLLAGRARGVDQEHPGGLAVGLGELAGLDLQLGEGVAHLAERRLAGGRAEQEVERRGAHGPAQDPDQRAGRRGGVEDHEGDGAPHDEPPAQRPERPGDVG